MNNFVTCLSKQRGTGTKVENVKLHHGYQFTEDIELFSASYSNCRYRVTRM